MASHVHMVPHGPTTILEVARNVATVFTRGRTSSIHPQLRSDLENHLGRFKIWAGNLGIFAPGNASADHRLRDDQDVKDVIIQMLDRLRQSIKQAIDPPILEEDEDDQPNDEDSEGSESSMAISLDRDSDGEANTEAEETSDPSDISRQALADVDDILTRLYRLSAIIRKPTSSNENVKVAKFIAKEDETPESEEYKASVSWQIRFRHPDISPAILERLIATVVFRRKKLQYRERHKEKLSQGIEHSDPANVLVPTNMQRATLLKTAHRRTSSPLLAQKATSVKSSSQTLQFSATDASSVDRLKFASYPKSVALSGLTKSAVARREQLDVPRPPVPGSDQSKEAICPYCFHVVDKEEMRHARWTRHILRDIEPYICLFDECERPNECFRTVEDWVNHMRWQHAMIWCCQAEGHETTTYHSKVDLERHMRLEHHEAFTQSQLPILIKKSAQPSPDLFTSLALALRKDNTVSDMFGVCPLCPFTLDLGGPSMSQSLEVEHSIDADSKKIRDHIAAHLESIALLSLPDRDDLEDAATNERETEDQQDVSHHDDHDLPTLDFNENTEDDVAVATEEEWQSDEHQSADLWASVLRDPRVRRLHCPDQAQDPTLKEFVARARRIEMFQIWRITRLPIIIVHDPDGLETGLEITGEPPPANPGVIPTIQLPEAEQEEPSKEQGV
ncbi:hypothetical protein K469DRAFT_690585 [Zopfia rhizophila CBS 207.26]|uniref:Uncharacterized protein n=1 Tax=Zopfia rhizophila CBS 207.26 TaxID=1314779 RepID=A0A6A6DX77_9PEZI|nr:hypothetical protein K469DRAFT_690585 [Zopfia rhizophila CBS 207.26]